MTSSEAPLSSAVARLLAHWGGLGVMTGPGCPADALTDFEARAGVRLPADLRSFLAVANGASMDPNGFAFWPLQAFEPLEVSAQRHEASWPRPADPGSYYVFCDYLDWSWGYAIELSGREGLHGRVVPVGMNEVFTIASSFSEFVDLYLSDSPLLYPP